MSIAHSQLNTQDAFNLGFELLNQRSVYPERWFNWGEGYKITPDSLQKFAGKYSLLIQPSGDWKKGQFGSPAISIPANYQGKEIELTGYLKLNNVQNGEAGLMLRIDGKNNTLQFDNMQNRKIQGTIEWKKYSIKLPLPPDAVTIFVAALNTGTGQVWVDNFELKIDGKALSQAPVKVSKQYKADLDTAFSKGSGINLASVDKGTLNDLVLLGKIWGFLKYYHPEIDAGNLNWDNELFKILPIILSKKNKHDRNKTLLAFIDNLGPIKVAGGSIPVKLTEVKFHTDLNWIEDSKELGEALSSRLRQVKNASRTDEHYYVDGVEGARNPNFKNEREYLSMAYPDDGFKLLSLYRYWNIIQYYFPYKHLIGEDWNMILPEFIPKFLAAKDQRTYTLACLEIIARIHDTHANIWDNKYLEEKIKGKFRLPVQAKFIENKLTVTGFYSDTLAINDKLHIGDIIEKINAEPVEQLVKKSLPLTPASNYPTQLRDLAKNLLRANSETFILQIMRNGKPLDITLSAVNLKSLNSAIDYDPHPEKPGFYVMDGNIGYLFPGKYKNDDLPAIKELFESTKGIIIDMRCYPSEFMPFTFGDYIKSNSNTFVQFTIADYNHPGTFILGSSLKNGGGFGKKYKKKIVVIVNEQSQSQAEYTTMAFQGSENVAVIGSTTAGADGNVSRIVLPGGIKTMISGIGIYYPDGTETQRAGVKINVPVKPTLNGIISGQDELLAKAGEIILREQ